jgi:hypothetical protein
MEFEAHCCNCSIHRVIYPGGWCVQQRVKSSISLAASLFSTEGCGFNRTSDTPAIMASMTSLTVALRE